MTEEYSPWGSRNSGSIGVLKKKRILRYFRPRNTVLCCFRTTASCQVCFSTTACNEVRPFLTTCLSHVCVPFQHFWAEKDIFVANCCIFTFFHEPLILDHLICLSIRYPVHEGSGRCCWSCCRRFSWWDDTNNIFWAIIMIIFEPVHWSDFCL